MRSCLCLLGVFLDERTDMDIRNHWNTRRRIFFQLEISPATEIFLNRDPWTVTWLWGEKGPVQRGNPKHGWRPRCRGQQHIDASVVEPRNEIERQVTWAVASYQSYHMRIEKETMTTEPEELTSVIAPSCYWSNLFIHRHLEPRVCQFYQEQVRGWDGLERVLIWGFVTNPGFEMDTWKCPLLEHHGMKPARNSTLSLSKQLYINLPWLSLLSPEVDNVSF